jgi:transposase, IS5 family
MREFKKTYRPVQRCKHARSQDPEKREATRDPLPERYRIDWEPAEGYRSRARDTRGRLQTLGGVPEIRRASLEGYRKHAERPMDPIRRRVRLGETIPPAEKVFLIFQPPTEGIRQGKAGVPVEGGRAVGIVEDRYRFSLHPEVMEKTTDKALARAWGEAPRERFPTRRALSLDTGFQSRPPQGALAERGEPVVLPKPGKRSAADRTRERLPFFVRLRHRPSAVESAINAWEVPGLDRCRDSGMTGFKRSVARAVVARTSQRRGAVLREPEREPERARRRGPSSKAA